MDIYWANKQSIEDYKKRPKTLVVLDNQKYLIIMLPKNLALAWPTVTNDLDGFNSETHFIENSKLAGEINSKLNKEFKILFPLWTNLERP